MGAVRLELRLANQSEWIKIFDPRDWTVFVPTTATEQVEIGARLRIDLDVGGWLVTLRGTVVGRRQEPSGVVVALGGSERDKINYLNGFVRGGLLNLREKRRLPIRLQVTYGAIEGPASTVTKDINEEGLFLFTERPLPATSQVHMLVTVPGKQHPLSLMGKVSHTIDSDDDEAPGMGIIFELDDAQRELIGAVVKELEEQLHAGQLPTTTLE
ncbi:MAG TPA: PilZ domain-containing protein [Kofleriaceae bacterium]|nr:PilZ domain-containing protein [Kofleriaceae bacterium]